MAHAAQTKGAARVVSPQSLSANTSAAQSHVILKEEVHLPFFQAKPKS